MPVRDLLVPNRPRERKHRDTEDRATESKELGPEERQPVIQRTVHKQDKGSKKGIRFQKPTVYQSTV
jgi:hypothetical protein